MPLHIAFLPDCNVVVCVCESVSRVYERFLHMSVNYFGFSCVCVCEQGRIGHREIRDFSRWAAAVGGLLPSVGRWLWHRWAVDFHSAAAPVPHPQPQTPAVARLRL